MLLNRRYRIISQVGQGGFGAVYKAADTLLGNRVVAVKEMSQEALSQPEITQAADTFKREALLLANLIHPHLPRVYDHFMQAGRWYLVMDFIEGDTLEDRLTKLADKRLSIEKVLDIGIQLCTVLDYLHKRQPPIIFRDLKPSNIMLTPDGHVYLIDFGIARHFKPGQAKDTIALGSIGYAAPEQYGRAQTSPQSDIYALGALLHQLLSGNDPSSNPFRFASLHLSNGANLIRLEKLIMRMVEMDAGKRPVDMATIKQELQQIMAQQSLQRSVTGSTVPGSPPPRVPFYTYRGHQAEVSTLAWSIDGKQIASVSNDGVMQIWEAMKGNPVSTYQGHSGYRYAITWLSQDPYVAVATPDKTVQIWDTIMAHRPIAPYAVRRSTGGRVLTYKGHSDYVYALAWSPDGKYIASGGKDKRVQVWDAVSRQQFFIGTGHDELIWVVAWSPDGKYIASGSWDHTVRVWNISAKNTALIYRGHTARLLALAWSPDGKYIASASGESERKIGIWEVTSGKNALPFIGLSHAINALAWSPDGKYIASASDPIYVMDVATGRPTHIYRGHSGAVNAIAWSPDGALIASAGLDKTVQIWEPK
jgi:WD40 repeat protein/tRNA A-37 threonylcarbamoyl transferase component Bud32